LTQKRTNSIIAAARASDEEELMKRRDFLWSAVSLPGLAGTPGICEALSGKGQERDTPYGIIGLYIHQHWPYNHPYAARTWTVEDYRGYAEGLSKLGFNTVMIWPLLETMPSPLTPSDRANLEKIAAVIELVHREFRMRVWVTLCPNVAANDQEAGRYTFEKRHFFYCDTRVNPADSAAVEKMVRWREVLFRPLAQADAVAIIVDLLARHRRMLDRVRSGIELYYWMHAGWVAYSRLYQTGEFKWGTAAEARDVLVRLKELNPEPWGITVNTLNDVFPPPEKTHLAVASTVGLAERAVGFSYGAIEGEPTFPMTNFGGDNAFNAGRTKAPRGVMGNAQTHCVQLPNTLAFSRGATGKPIARGDYVEFANDLIAGQGELIVEAWEKLAGKNSGSMRDAGARLAELARERLKTGRLRGLLFSDPNRFVTDLVMQLRLKGAFEDFVAAAANDRDPKQPLRDFVAAAKAWQKQHGYQCAWSWAGLRESLKKLRSPAIDAVLDQKATGKTPFDCVEDQLRQTETFTTRLILAMEQAASS
jgi:hypothetical protein